MNASKKGYAVPAPEEAVASCDMVEEALKWLVTVVAAAVASSAEACEPCWTRQLEHTADV